MYTEHFCYLDNWNRFLFFMKRLDYNLNIIEKNAFIRTEYNCINYYFILVKNEVFVPGDLILYLFKSVKLSLLFFYTKDLQNIMFTYIILNKYLFLTFDVWVDYRTTVCLYTSIINNRCNVPHCGIRINHTKHVLFYFIIFIEDW